jgi:regulatory protein YycI of two-component signal transduction system YycFG
MDWSKAKTILITAFTIINIFLGTNLWFKNNDINKVTAVSVKEMEEVKRFLKQEGIIVDADIPKKVEPQPFLMIGYKKTDAKKVAQSFFNDLKGVSYEKVKDSTTFQKGFQQLIVMENGIISYFNNEEKGEIYKDLDENRARELAEEFIKKHGGFPPNAEYDRTIYYNQSKSYLVEYVQVYRGKFLASSYIDVLVTPSGIKSYYCSWLEPLGYSGNSKKIISPAHALLKMVDILEKVEKPVRVTGIHLGYYSRYYNAEKWQAVPVWRISVEKDEYYYINGYTGELEQ